MDNIDIIYYTATTTNLSPDGAMTGYNVTESQYFVPFLDFLLVFLVLIFSTIAILVVDYFCYPRPQVIKLKNNIKITKKVKY